MVEGYGEDEWGPYAVAGCVDPGCMAHESVRPGPGALVSPDELLEVLWDFMRGDGWSVLTDGDAVYAWCPKHRTGDGRTMPWH